MGAALKPLADASTLLLTYAQVISSLLVALPRVEWPEPFASIARVLTLTRTRTLTRTLTLILTLTRTLILTLTLTLTRCSASSRSTSRRSSASTRWA